MSTRLERPPGASPARQASLWGHLTFNYLTEIMAEGVYEQVLHHLGDPEVHARISRFLDEERHHALGLSSHLREVGPGLPDSFVGAFRDLSRMLGLFFALRGTNAFVEHVHQLEQLGERWYGQLSERFPAGSIEARRYERYRDQETAHVGWLEEYQARQLQDGLAGQVEVVEFASIVPAPIEEVFAFYTDTRSLGVLLGVPVRCPEGVTHFREGDRFHLAVGPAPFAVTVDAHIAAMDAPYFYVDRKTRMPFDRWEHHHHFTPMGPRETLLSDRLLVRPRYLPPLPEALQPSPWKLALTALLWWRHSRTQAAFGRG
jgi:ligand-binding SRPBCC domain-containing protein/demethoxyubiquinone hydroxylase (CLK1/Coq7/Cat5 family)